MVFGVVVEIFVDEVFFFVLCFVVSGEELVMVIRVDLVVPLFGCVVGSLCFSVATEDLLGRPTSPAFILCTTTLFLL